MFTTGAYLLAPAPVGRALADPTEPTAHPHATSRSITVSRHQRPISALAVVTLAGLALTVTACGDDSDSGRRRRRRARRRERRTVPRRTVRGQSGRRHDHLPVELRLRRRRLHRRGPGRRGTRLLRRGVPRRRHPAQLLDRQLPADRRQRRPVLVGRLVQRDRHVRDRQRGRLRRPRGGRPHGDRRSDRQAGRGRDPRGSPRHARSA